MSRITRRHKASELLHTAVQGPAFNDEKSRRIYRLWSTTWLIPNLPRLIPELKDVKLPPITSEPDPFWNSYPVQGDPL